MILTITLQGKQLAHMQPQQYGAFVAHMLQQSAVESVKTFRENRVEISFQVDGGNIAISEPTLLAELETFGSMEPFPCPCGCGAFISVSPCFVQSGDMMRGKLTQEEFERAKSGDMIGAIKMVRVRTGLGLKDAKDLVEQSGAYVYPISPSSIPPKPYPRF